MGKKRMPKGLGGRRGKANKVKKSVAGASPAVVAHVLSEAGNDGFPMTKEAAAQLASLRGHLVDPASQAQQPVYLALPLLHTGFAAALGRECETYEGWEAVVGRDDMYGIHRACLVHDGSQANAAAMGPHATLLTTWLQRAATLSLLGGPAASTQHVHSMWIDRFDAHGTQLCQRGASRKDPPGSRRLVIFVCAPSQPWTAGGSLDFFATPPPGGEAGPSEIAAVVEPGAGVGVLWEPGAHGYHEFAETLQAGLFVVHAVLAASQDAATVAAAAAAPNEDQHMDEWGTDGCSSTTSLLAHAGADKDGGEALLSQWLAPLYANQDPVHEAIRSSFADESLAVLDDVMRATRYAELVDDLLEDHVGWEPVGPATQRHVFHVGAPGHDTGPIPSTSSVVQLLSVAHSPAFHAWVANVTGVAVQRVAGARWRRFNPGCYTRLSDTLCPNTTCLDVIFCCATGDVVEGAGGALVYRAEESARDAGAGNNAGGGGEVSQEEDGNLLVVPPMPNALILVYREADVQRYVSYVNRTCNQIIFQLDVVLVEDDG